MKSDLCVGNRCQPATLLNDPSEQVTQADATDPPSSSWGAALEPAPITLCVINYNGESLLADTLRAAEASNPPFAEILLLDNASTDDSRALAEREFPQVRIVALPRNEGPGHARNVGFEQASFSRVLFVDNDVLLDPGCAARLTTELDSDDDAVIAVPRVLYRQAPTVIQYDGASSHFLGMMSLEHADTPVLDAPVNTRSIDSLVSACFLVDRDRWHGGDLFDDAFFIYHEDHDLGLRTRLGGGSILSVPHALCLHGDGTAGLSLRATGTYKPVRVLGNIRNRWLILLKNYELRTLLLLAPALVTYEAFQLAGALRKRWHREWWQAFTSVLADRRIIMEKRRQVQSLRRVSDSLVLRGGEIPFTSRLATGRGERFAQGTLNAICSGYWNVVHRWL